MTPVVSWTPADYHRAFNRARAAWEATSPQLTIDGWANMMDGLDEAAPDDLGLVEPVANPVPPPVAGSPLGAEPSRDPLHGAGLLTSPHAVGLLDGGPSAPSYTTTPRPAEPGWDLRGSGQKGA